MNRGTMRFLLINLPSLGYKNETIVNKLKDALILLNNYDFDVILYNTDLDDCKCCCEITKLLRRRFGGILISVINDCVECCAKATSSGASNYIRLSDYNKMHVQDIINFEFYRNNFNKNLKDYKQLISALAI